jgi:GntR family transcriptional regulator, transcriptional repressor for pyruvate dehydrogenase complex
MDKWTGHYDNMSNDSNDHRLIDNIQHKIQELIFSGSISVGDRLPSGRELAKEFGVSRGVVREALKLVEQSGLIEIRIGSKGGAYVTLNYHMPLFSTLQGLLKRGELTLDHFYQVRRTNECANVQLACGRAASKDLEHLSALNRKVLDGLDSESNLLSKEANRNFHLAIAKIAGNPLATLISNSILLLTDMFYPGSDQFQEFVRKMYDRHEAIIDAMKSRDVILCSLLMARDIEYTKYLSTKEQGPQFSEKK